MSACRTAQRSDLCDISLQQNPSSVSPCMYTRLSERCSVPSVSSCNQREIHNFVLISAAELSFLFRRRRRRRVVRLHRRDALRREVGRHRGVVHGGHGVGHCHLSEKIRSKLLLALKSAGTYKDDHGGQRLHFVYIYYF